MRIEGLRVGLTIGAALTLSFSASLYAQDIPEVSPGGTLSNPSAPPPAPAAQPTTIILPGGDAPAEEPVDTGYYHTDGLPGEVQSMPSGVVPETHVVRRGDTLWDICGLYFNNPWEWPRIWSYNPTITNPHWIYPGDIVRLRKPGETVPVTETSMIPIDVDGGETPSRPRGNFALRQSAFVDKDEKKLSGEIVGSTEERTLLAHGDSIYLDYDESKPPKVGKKLAIYQEKKKISDSEGNNVGSYVRIFGEAEIVSVKEDKRARAVITDSIDVIERGMRVGPVLRQFKDVEPVPNQKSLQAYIVAQLEQDELIGARQVVILDKGKDDGIVVGNRLFVVRRGDAYKPIMEPGGSVGQDDERFPSRALGEVLVVQAGKNASVAVVSISVQEIGIGDRVVMRRE